MKKRPDKLNNSILKDRMEKVKELQADAYEFEEAGSSEAHTSQNPELAFFFMVRDIIVDMTEIRLRKGITQIEMAKLLNKKQEAVSRFENYRGQPTLESIYEYANALGVDLEMKPGHQYAISEVQPHPARPENCIDIAVHSQNESSTASGLQFLPMAASIVMSIKEGSESTSQTITPNSTPDNDYELGFA